MRFNLLLLSFFVIALSTTAQNKPAYRIFNPKGHKISYKKMLKAAGKADIVFFGELHNNAISHWLQYELTNDLLQNQPLTLGAEMFEADNQEALNRYLSGVTDAGQLEKEARLWPNYRTDYSPLVDLAKDNQIPFIATNVPRRYASMVYKYGSASLDTLPATEKIWIAPLPFAYDSQVGCYKKMLSMGGGHGGDNLPKAQAIKDATMAHFILSHLRNDRLFIHFNGAYHSDDHEGIIWHIHRSRPELKILTLSTVNQNDLKKLNEEHKGKADFIIVVDENMTPTY